MGELQNSQRTSMFSTYRTTGKGKQTRSHLLRHIHPSEERTRDDLVQRSGLTYEQVRRQTRNLVADGTIESRLSNGQRYYRLTPKESLRERQNFIHSSVVSA